MALELSGTAVDAFNFIGLPWPAVDEDELRDWADDLRSFAASITDLAHMSHAAIKGLQETNQSSVVSTLVRQWDHHHALLMASREPMEAFAAALDVAAEAVTVQKRVVIGAAIALGAEVIATQGEALVTLGLAEGELPIEVEITKKVVKFALQELENKLLGYLINQASTEVSDHLQRTASNLLLSGMDVYYETTTLRMDYDTLQKVAKVMRGHGNALENESSRVHRRATSRQIETDGQGGRWPIGRILEEALRSLAQDIFLSFPKVFHEVVEDTEHDLDRVIARSRATDAALAHGAGGDHHGTTPDHSDTTAGAAATGGAAVAGATAYRIKPGPPGRQPVISSDGDIDFAGRGSIRQANTDGSHSLYLNGEKYPASAQHVRDAQAAGHPRTLTIDNSPGHKENADERRGQSLSNFRSNYRQSTGNAYENVDREDLDEYPPARSLEGGRRLTGTPRETHASVRSIGHSDNRGSGSSWWNHGVKGLPHGTKVHVVPVFREPEP